VLGYPHLAFDEAVRELGAELIEHITAQGFIVVPVEEFVRDHRDAKSDLWDQLSDQGVDAAIENVPSPLHRLVLSQWNPTADNLFAAHRSPDKPPELTEKDQELLRSFFPKGTSGQFQFGQVDKLESAQRLT
jgi:hypothetical protein